MPKIQQDAQDAIRAREIVSALAMVQRAQIRTGAIRPRPETIDKDAAQERAVQQHLGRPLTTREVDATAVLYRNGHAAFAIAALFKLAESVS